MVKPFSYIHEKKERKKKTWWELWLQAKGKWIEKIKTKLSKTNLFVILFFSLLKRTNYKLTNLFHLRVKSLTLKSKNEFNDINMENEENNARASFSIQKFFFITIIIRMLISIFIPFYLSNNFIHPYPTIVLLLSFTFVRCLAHKSFVEFIYMMRETGIFLLNMERTPLIRILFSFFSSMIIN